LKELIQPKFEIEVKGYQFVRRGCDKSGWSTRSDIYYRCANCGGFMKGSLRESYQCDCKAMSLDFDFGRFGSRYGDDNILTYRKL
jgi:hypothetical protein